MITAGILAAICGITLRLVWTKTVTEGAMYNVPVFWALLAMAISAFYAPKSLAFMLGIFIFDFIYFVIKDDEDLKEKYKDILNNILNKVPVNEKSE